MRSRVGVTEMPFERIDTHLSTLLLAGDRVFKFKKPVTLPFADYSTAERRRRYCEEELRLNRRTAPELYRGVVEIAGEPALEMARFDGAGLFDALARHGELTAAHVEALAEAIAAFQATLSGTPPPGFDAAEVAARWAAANLEELQAQAGPLPDLVAWDRERAAALAPLLRARQAAGKVVEGHGDLHLGNIVWHRGRPRMFDAIEFHPELRWSDRLADPAFTFMDLLDHGLPGLAWRFLSRWLDAGGDHDALPLLRWSATYRALVRAKVAGLQGRPDRRAERIALARGLAFARPPQLVLTTGLSGSGKSRVALALAERWGGVRVRSDIERRRLFPDPATRYATEATERTYARLGEIAQAALAGGVTVVLDAAYLRGAERDAMRALAARAGLRCRLIECRAAPATLAARIEARRKAGGDPSEATLEVLALQQRVAEPLAADEAVALIDTEGDWAEVEARLAALSA